MLAGVATRTGVSDVQARVQAAGSWSAWEDLGAGEGHQPDGWVRARASNPIWIRGADAIQVRTAGASGDPRLKIIRGGGGVGADPEGHLPGAPKFISRSAWRAQRPRHRAGIGKVKAVFVHHTVNANDYGRQESAAIVRSIQEYHRNVLGWDDIGYNALVDRFGRIFEGRAGGLDKAVIGAQAQGFNAQSAGVALIGDFSNESPSRQAVAGLVRYLAWKLAIHDLDPEGVVRLRSTGGESSRVGAGETLRVDRVAGHRKADLTECPGNGLNRELPHIRESVAARMAS